MIEYKNKVTQFLSQIQHSLGNKTRFIGSEIFQSIFKN